MRSEPGVLLVLLIGYLVYRLLDLFTIRKKYRQLNLKLDRIGRNAQNRSDQMRAFVDVVGENARVLLRQKRFTKMIDENYGIIVMSIILAIFAVLGIGFVILREVREGQANSLLMTFLSFFVSIVAVGMKYQIETVKEMVERGRNP